MSVVLIVNKRFGLCAWCVKCVYFWLSSWQQHSRYTVCFLVWRLSSELVQAVAYAMVTARVQGREAVSVHEAGR